jgi:hypothetical protein
MTKCKNKQRKEQTGENGTRNNEKKKKVIANVSNLIPRCIFLTQVYVCPAPLLPKSLDETYLVTL